MCSIFSKAEIMQLKVKGREEKGNYCFVGNRLEPKVCQSKLQMTW